MATAKDCGQTAASTLSQTSNTSANHTAHIMDMADTAKLKAQAVSYNQTASAICTHTVETTHNM